MTLTDEIVCMTEHESELTPQKLNKIRARAHKWLAHFNTLIRNAHAEKCENTTCAHDTSFITQRHENDGFVVLNGGMHAGCTPYEVRRLLIDMNVLHESTLGHVLKVNTSAANVTSTKKATMARKADYNVDYNTQILRYGSTLPFVVVTAPMNTSAPCLSCIHITNTCKFKTPHRHAKCSSLEQQEEQNEVNISNNIKEHSAVDMQKGIKKGANDDKDETVVYVLPVPSSRQLWNQGSSVNFNCGFLFMVQCHTSTIIEEFAEYFSKPVLGVELFVKAHLHDEQSALEPNHVNEVDNNNKPKVRKLPCITFVEIPGLLCIPEFITEREHDDVLNEMIRILESSSKETSSQERLQASCTDNTNNTNNNDNTSSMNEHHTEYAEHKRGRKEYLSRRHVVHFNRRFIYENNTMGEIGDGVGNLPSFYHWMRERIANTSDDVIIELPYPFPHTCASDKSANTDQLQNGNSCKAITNCINVTNNLDDNDKVMADEFCEYGDKSNNNTAAIEKWCDQLTANYYYYDAHIKGKSTSGIAAHVDAHRSIGEYIFIVSLGSYTVMDFVRPASSGSGDTKAFSVYIPARSLVVMSGESRYGWTHCIAEKRTDTLHETLPTQTRSDRVSLTWRRGRRDAHCKATCQWPELCDGQ